MRRDPVTPELREAVTRRDLSFVRVEMPTPCIEEPPSDERGYVSRGHGQYEHRRRYERAFGPIPDGLEIDHLCRNRSCFNPEHLEAVTHQVNVRRAMSLITHCSHGHEYTPANTSLVRATGYRQCRTCHRENERRRHVGRRDPVTPELREAVLRRDGRCVLAMFDVAHACYDANGERHESDDLDRLTLDHVKDKLRMGLRAPSDMGHLVALCGYRNAIRPPTKVEREFFRLYLRKVAV